ncbi:MULTISPECIES: LacI family DNA-binding transcriptional regulator [unclassified Paraburkholderia]|uniref:LacI family DNA-binding transcriptional regulator n=1 Tax=unclassified Paraburkholderia TaxID=2615204 RepID=UPI002AB1ADDB|nr:MULTISPECIES: LacI family DNA-binding transcriptional regulator [unclassified Paraburkholderia]
MSTKEKSWAVAEDVARMAGVSRSAVSRTFTPGASVSAKTRARVLEAARTLNYHVDINARNTIQGRSNFVGVVTSALASPFRAQLLTPIAHHLGTRGMLPILMNADDPDQISYALHVLLSYRIAGVIMTSGAPPLALAREYLDRQVPVAMINRVAELEGADLVNSDNAAGGALAARALFDSGALRFAFIGPQATHHGARQRCEGFLVGLANCGVRRARATVCNTTIVSYEAGQLAARELFAGSGEAPDGVFCATDMIALGFMDEARRAFNRRIPDDVRVVGFDDIQHAALDSYRLSTIAQNTDALAQGAVDLLAERIGDFSRPTQARVIPVSFVRRATTG